MRTVIHFAYIFNDSEIVTAVPDWCHKSLFMKGCLAGQVLNSSASRTIYQKISYIPLQTSRSTKQVWKYLYV